MNLEKTPQARLKPGMRCDIIVSVNPTSEKADIRRATVYDVVKNTVILSQTTPPLTPRLFKKKMDITFLVKRTENVARWGFQATFSQIRTDFKLESGELVFAVVMELPNGSVAETAYDLRMFYRVKAPPRCGIQVCLAETPLQLIDFSAAGLRFNHGRDLDLKIGQTVSLRLFIDGEAHDAEVRIVRQFTPPHDQKKPIVCSCVELANPSRRLVNRLTKKVLDVERFHLSRGRL